MALLESPGESRLWCGIRGAERRSVRLFRYSMGSMSIRLKHYSNSVPGGLNATGLDALSSLEAVRQSALGAVKVDAVPHILFEWPHTAVRQGC